jgi:hypothetical protein
MFYSLWEALSPPEPPTSLRARQAGRRFEPIARWCPMQAPVPGIDHQVQSGAALNVATIDFLARGGDQYPFGGAPFTTLGVSYQQALRNYLTEPLGGVVTAAQYPTGGEGRITTMCEPKRLSG